MQNLLVRFPRKETLPALLVLAWMVLLSACETSVDQSEAFRPPREDALPSPTAISLPVTATFPISCVNDARFIEDLTIADGSVVRPRQEIDKRWSVLNNGTCDWGPGYMLLRRDESDIGGGEELALYPARQGEQAVWQATLIAPGEGGEYLASWQAISPEGESFGDVVFILIVVEEDAANPE